MTLSPRRQPVFLGAVCFEQDEPVDLVLEAVVRQLEMDGLRVSGYLQRETQVGSACCSVIDLESIADGRKFRITQALGSGSRGCRLDPGALADLCGPLSKELDEGVDILVLNRFGKGEAEGQGFRAVIEDAFQKGIPVLVAVLEAYLEALGTLLEVPSLKICLPMSKGSSTGVVVRQARRPEPAHSGEAMPVGGRTTPDWRFGPSI